MEYGASKLIERKKGIKSLYRDLLLKGSARASQKIEPNQLDGDNPSKSEN